jgi:hypothetical protein
MGRAYSTHWRENECIRFGGKEDVDIGGRIILKWIIGWDSMDYVDVTQDRGQWRAVVNTVMYLRAP